MPSNLEDRLTKMEEKIAKILERSKSMEDIVYNQKVLHKELEGFKKNFELFSKKSEGIQKEVSFLQAENLSLKRELNDLRMSLEESVHSGMSNEVEVTGVVPVSGENLKATVMKVASKISVMISESDLVDVCRKVVGKNKNSIIRMKFVNSSLRDTFIASGRKSRLKSDDLGIAGNSQPIYFNEPLSFYSRKLFFEARKLKSEIGYKYVWTKKGKIYVRKADKEPPILIACMGDIITLRK